MKKKILLWLLLCSTVLAQTNLGPILVTTEDSKGTLVTPDFPKADYCRSYFDLGTSKIAWIDHTGAPCGPVPGASAIANIYTAGLPLPSIEGTFGLAVPASGLKNLNMYGPGNNWFNINPFDSDAGLWGCDNTGATDAQPCLDLMFKSLAAGSSPSQAIHLPRGVFLLSTPLRISREVKIVGNGGTFDRPGTLFKLGPGANIVFEGLGTSTDGDTGQWSTFSDVVIDATQMSCTGTIGNATLASCNQDPSTFLQLAADDYLVAVGTAAWIPAFPQGTQVASLTSNSITMAGGAVSAITGPVTVMKSGFIATSGTTSVSSTLVTGLACPTCFSVGDAIQGPGIPYPDFVSARNVGAQTLTLRTAAGAGAGAGNLTKGPLANLKMHGGTVVVANVGMHYCVGACYEVVSGIGVVADGQLVYNLRPKWAGGPCTRMLGSDANTSTFIGVQATNCAEGIEENSFLGNTYMGGQIAGSFGTAAYHSESLNASNLLLNQYSEGGNVIPRYTTTSLIVCGANQINTNGQLNGNYILCGGQISPSFFYNNDQGGQSTVSMKQGNPVLTNVTSIAAHPVGTPITGVGIPANSFVIVNDGVSSLTLNNNATVTADIIPVTTFRTQGSLGEPSVGNGLFTFAYINNAALLQSLRFQFQDPYASLAESGDVCWNDSVVNVFCMTTAESRTAWDHNGTTTSKDRAVFPLGIRIGASANKQEIKGTAGAVVPTTLEWPRGSLAIGLTGGLFQQTIASKVSSAAHIDTTANSAALASPDAAFTGQCAPSDSITGTGIPNSTYLVDQSTLSRRATATGTAAVVCTHLPVAHVVTTCDTHTNTTLDSCNTVAGWSVNDPIRGTGIPAGTFVTAVGALSLTISQAATASAAGVTMTDAAFQTFQVSTGTTSVVKVVSGTIGLTASTAASGVCNTVSTSATGALTTDTLSWAFNASPAAVTGYGGGTTGNVVQIYPYLTAGNVNVDICNNSAGSISYGLATLRWTVER